MTDPLLNDGETYEEMRLWAEAQEAAAKAAETVPATADGEAPEVT